MKTIQEVKAQFKTEGLYLINPQFELTDEVTEILIHVAEFYGYAICIENDVIYEISISDNDDSFAKILNGKEGLIESLEGWHYTMKCNYEELMEENQPDSSTISLANSYKRDMDIIRDFMETLR